VVSTVTGTWGAVWLALALLFAIYSSGAAYLGGFSSLIMHDLYQKYVEKRPENETVSAKAARDKKELLYIRLISIAYGVGIAIVVVLLQKVSLLDTMLSTGVFISAAFFPIVAGLWWKRTSSLAATLGIVASVGICLYLMLWTDVELTWVYIASYAISVGVTVLVSLIKPDDYDYEALRERMSLAAEQADAEKARLAAAAAAGEV